MASASFSSQRARSVAGSDDQSGKAAPAAATAASTSAASPSATRAKGLPVAGSNTSSQRPGDASRRSEEHTSELQSLMRISYAVFCLKKKRTESYKTISCNEHTSKVQAIM